MTQPNLSVTHYVGGAGFEPANSIKVLFFHVFQCPQ